MKVALLLSICVSLWTTAYSKPGGIFGKCPNPPVVQDFNLSSYLGVWYEIARFEAIFEIGSECNTANYSMLPNGHIRVLNSGVKTTSGEINQAVGEVYIPDPAAGAKIEVKFSSGENFTGKPNYWVLSTDYTRYSLVYSCEQFTEFFHFELAWILSRTPTISESLRQELLARYESLGIDISKFHFTPQGEEGKCKYHYPNPPSETRSSARIVE